MEQIDYLARWGHFLSGITWIGLLYYFNFVQGEYFKEADPDARTDAFTKLVPRALWWFRWGAMFTFLSGCVLLGIRGANLSLDITIGAVMGTLMFLNVWLIIWPNQKIVIASNEQVKAGGEARPGAAEAAPKAALASRTNTLFSLPMLFFMGSSTHLSSTSGLGHGMVGSAGMTALIVALVIVTALQLNAIFGKQGPLTTVRGVIVSGFVLTGVLWGVLELL
ncbi:MAG: antitermination protein NusG [Gammaproteobacteria bacterium]|nr:MAG: antitermination protein NusG [Gammaproteobacteria bacterium]